MVRWHYSSCYLCWHQQRRDCGEPTYWWLPCHCCEPTTSTPPQYYQYYYCLMLPNFYTLLPAQTESNLHKSWKQYIVHQISDYLLLASHLSYLPQDYSPGESQQIVSNSGEKLLVLLAKKPLARHQTDFFYGRKKDKNFTTNWPSESGGCQLRNVPG